MPSTRGVSGVTLRDFLSAVLSGLGAPVTENNLAKLGAVARVEGHGGNYNPFNYVVAAPGSTDFNSVGVQNYPDAATGITMTVKLLRGSRESQKRMLSSLMANDTYSTFIHAAQDFYNSWGGADGARLLGGTASERALQKLTEQVDGPPGSLSGVTPGPPYDPTRWANAQEGAFGAWLGTQDAGTQQQIIDRLRGANGDLGAIAGILNDPNTNQATRDYINYLAQLDKSGQGAALGRLGVQSRDPGPSSPTPAPSPELTDLLRSLGVSYPNAPQPTPALMAFLRGVGLNLDSAAALRERAVQRIGASMSDAMSDIDRHAGREKQNITADLVRRGVLSSGESNTRYARQAEDVGEQKTDVLTTGGNAKEDVQTAYDQAVSAARQQALDRVIGAETDQATAAASAKAATDAMTKAQQQAELDYARQRAAQEDAVRQTIGAQRGYAERGAAV